MLFSRFINAKALATKQWVLYDVQEDAVIDIDSLFSLEKWYDSGLRRITYKLFIECILLRNICRNIEYHCHMYCCHVASLIFKDNVFEYECKCSCCRITG